MVDVGLATLILAFVPVVVAGGGFLLRELHLRRRLAAALLQEVRLKLANLERNGPWSDAVRSMLVRGENPRVLMEGQYDFIFDENRSRLLSLHRAVLRRVVRFYHLDDFYNLAMAEFRDGEFLKIAPERKLAHLRNSETSLLMPAIRAGIFAEWALTIAADLTILQTLSFAARQNATATFHVRAIAQARRTARARLARLADLRRKRAIAWENQ